MTTPKLGAYSPPWPLLDLPRFPHGANQYLTTAWYSYSIPMYHTILPPNLPSPQPPSLLPPQISCVDHPRWRGHTRRIALRWPRRLCGCWPPSPPSSYRRLLPRRVTAGGEAAVFWSTPSDRPSPPRPSRRGGRRRRRCRRCRRRSPSPGLGRSDRSASIRYEDASPSSSPRSQRGGRRRRRCSAATRPHCDPSSARRAGPSPFSSRLFR